MTSSEQNGPVPGPTGSPHGGHAGALDRWAGENPWHPRVGPWALYMCILAGIILLREPVVQSYAPLKLIQAIAVCWLVWRWRSFTPELTLRFHWLAIPIGVGVFVVWVALGKQMLVWFPNAFEDLTEKESFFEEMGLYFGWAGLIAHLIAMTTAVPIVEEMFNRSLLLRSLHRPKQTMIGLVQVIADFPLIGDWVMHTRIGEMATMQPPVFGREFEATPFGKLSVFGVLASTLVFSFVHHPRDWPACFVCGIAYCALVGATRKHGLGPVIWAHAITNALLWGYVIYFNDWQFV